MLPQGFFVVNIWGVLIAAVLSMILGMLWYSRFLFGKPWMELMGLTPESLKAMQKTAQKGYALSVVLYIILAYVLGIFIRNLFVPFMVTALIIGFLVWLGFVATTMAM